MSIQKYQIKDRVKKIARNECITHSVRYRQITEDLGIKANRYGTIIDVMTKKDSKKRTYYYYYVTWDDSKTTSQHSQNTLGVLEEV